MTPIPPVSKIDEVLKLAMPQAHAAPQGAVSPELSDKFQALMQRHDTEVSQSTRGRGPGAISDILERQQNELTQVQTSMQDFIEKAPTLSPSDRFVAGAAMMQKESLVHMKMSLAMGVTKSSNKSLQTLLKNE